MGSSSSVEVNRSDSQSFKKLLSREEVDELYWEPYVLTGYRRPGTSFYQCFLYTLVPHNDMGNFWTHFIPFLVWLTWLIVLALTSVDFSDPYHYPLLCFWIGSCSYALFSSIAHLFGCKSYGVRTVCFLLDYLGIAMYALGGDIAALFYMSSANSPVFRHMPLILTSLVLFAVSSTVLCGLSRFFCRDYRFVIRVSSYGLPYLCCVGPYLHRLYTCWWYGTDCVPETTPFHAAGFAFTVIIVFFFVTKFPERWSPGRFDVLFQSHQLFHISTAALTSLQMHYVPLEMRLRRQALSGVEGAMPDWTTTFVPFVGALIGGLLMVVLLGYLTKTGILTSNKYDAKKQH